MAKIVNSDKLKLILTQYGLDRITEAVENPSLNLNIAKIKLGSGDNEEYYTPSQDQEDLKGPIEGLEFYIFDKELLEDDQTISFHTIITEDIGGFDIREVGLYETVDGEDHLFAISTQQPFVKPSSAYNYYINVDYYIFLKATKFADVYDQITLDVEHALVTEPNLEELMRTFLFAQGNLINQIGNNSRIIGYNRATQLYERINENKKTFSYMTLYNNYADLLDAVTTDSNIFSYWVFDYSRREALQNSVVDLSSNSYYLTTNKALSNYPQKYYGYTSMFGFEEPNNFSLGSDILVNLYDSETDMDSPFTMMFVVDPIKTGVDRTLIAKSEYTTTNVHMFEVTETANDEIKVRLFSDANNYITFTSTQGIVPHKAHTLILTYNPYDRTMKAHINSQKYNLEYSATGNYSHINVTPGTLYSFSYIPTIYADSNTSGSITTLYNQDGTDYEAGDEEFKWSIFEGEARCNNQSSSYANSYFTITRYKWVYEDKYVYTNDRYPTSSTQLYNEDFSLYTGEEFEIIYKDGTYRVVFSENNENAEYSSSISKTLYKWTCPILTQTIWANSQYGSRIVLFYNSDNSVYTGDAWHIEVIPSPTEEEPEAVSYQVFYKNERPNGGTSTKSNYIPPLTSYIINSSGNAEKNINSYVGLISIIKEELSEEKVKVLSLILEATAGKNPYLNGGNS